ncbi:MAG TPA: BTAD domain-containing putative transcriptional regulator [Gaiella sp.]|nr:BTAD domain-containing putative transcriptional regulator [Gaiella sp.]
MLGPLEARSARAPLPLGGPRQRAVLANLLLHVGSVVSVDGLIDDLWGASQPATAEAVVQNAVSRLRKALGREAIETRPPGYVLRVDPGAIDARRFERLVHEARPLPPAERSAALRDALGLWRGPAFADLAFESFLQDEIARLDELRLTALEDRLEAEIELGRHDEVIADAAALGSQHPDRERLCRLLMLALHRAGRQQEALDAYEATRRALDEQWGLEPAAETRALQTMILTQDPAIARAEPVSRAVGAVRRPVSLLLVEPLLEDELELEAAGAAMEEVRQAVADVVARHDGALSPESGVELVAAFGAEGAHEDDVVRAARAAVELREILRDREVEARYAVGTGRLLVDDSRPVLVGAVVGRTRRALHGAEANEIRLTEVAARLGGDAVEADTEGRLLGVRRGRPRSTAVMTPLVGRSAELDSLRSAYERVVETGRPQHAVVVGEAGIGKTRLVAGFVEDVPATGLAAACIPYGEGISFLPLYELADRAAALDDGAPALGDLHSADAALAAARALCEHFTASGPLVVVLDDLHWAVPTFLDLVEYLVRAVDGPLLVVSATRPELLERRPAWGEQATVLEPLSGDDARHLVEGLPEHDGLDEQVTTAILDAAEGVPLFLEQLAAHAAETDLAGDRIPPSIDALLASRIDVLEPGERAVLSRAAVIGRAFSRESIGALTPDAELRELDGRVASLARRSLVRQRGADHEFVHPLVRGASYDAIGRAERAGMHERFARWLDGRGEDDALVGTHFERAALDAADRDRRLSLSRDAAERLGRAGTQALMTLDHAAARNLLGRAAALLPPSDPSRLELELRLGEVLKGLGENEDAVALLEDVAERARATGDSRIELRSRVELVWPRLLDGSLAASAAAELLDEALVRLDDADDHVGVARAEFTYALLLGDFGNRCDLALEHVNRAENAYRQHGVAGYTSTATVGFAVYGSTSVSDTLVLCENLMRSEERHPRALAYLRSWLAYLRALSGDLDGARESAARARLELQELGDELQLGTSEAATLGSIEALAADWDAAGEIFESAYAFTRQRPFWRAWRAYFLARLGEVALGRGDPQTAVQLADEARQLSPPDDAWTFVWWRRVAGRALAATGNAGKGLRFAREAVTITERSDDLLARGEAKLDLAEVLISAGKHVEAAGVARAGIELLDAKGAVLPAANGRSRFASLLAAEDGGGAAPAAPPEHVR